MKRVLFFGSYPNAVQPNLNIFFRNLIYAMADTGIECHVISPVSVTKYKGRIGSIEKKSVETTPNGSKVYVYRPRFLSLSAKKVCGFNTGIITNYFLNHAALKCAKSLNIDFDATYGHFFVGGGRAAIKAGRVFDIPSYVAYGECSYQTEIVNLFRPLKKNDLKGLTGVVSVSQKNTQELIDTGIFGDIPIFTCENAVDMSLFGNLSKEEARKKFGLPADDFIVGFVGSFIDRKGDKRLLNACEDIDGLSLAYAGVGSEPPKGRNVVFCRSVIHDEIGDFLSALDVFALPTLNEGCCNAVLEAMAAGCAIVSSDLSFNDGVLDDTNSIRINPESIDAIKNSIIMLKNDNDLRIRLANKAREDSCNFTIEKRAEKIIGFMASSASK